MKLQSVKKILMAAQMNQQHGLIKYSTNCVDFDFTGAIQDTDECDIVAFDNEAEVVEVLGKARNAYIECEAIECIEVFRQ